MLRSDADGLYRTMGNTSFNKKGTVAFWALLDNGIRGIFTGPDPVADKVIATGDLLFGLPVTDVNFPQGIGLNNRGQVAFIAELNDGTEGVYRADPAPPN